MKKSSPGADVSRVGPVTVDGACLESCFDFKRSNRILGLKENVHEVTAVTHVVGLGYSFVEIRTHAEAAGRDFSRFEVGHVIGIYFSATVEQAAERMARFRESAWGHPCHPELVAHLQAVGPPPEVCRRRLAEFIAAGVDRICLQAECPWEEFEDQLDLIRTEILERRDEIHSMAESLGA